MLKRSKKLKVQFFTTVLSHFGLSRNRSYNIVYKFAGESTDMYAENLQSDNNEVDVDDSSEPNQSNPNASTSSVVIVPSDDDQENAANVSQPQETQQIQAISASDSGSSGSSTPWRGQTGQATSRQQQVDFFLS